MKNFIITIMSLLGAAAIMFGSALTAAAGMGY